jgi:hypothetical protein
MFRREKNEMVRAKELVSTVLSFLLVIATPPLETRAQVSGAGEVFYRSQFWSFVYVARDPQNRCYELVDLIGAARFLCRL